jgi:hypothetical protein
MIGKLSIDGFRFCLWVVDYLVYLATGEFAVVNISIKQMMSRAKFVVEIGHQQVLLLELLAYLEFLQQYLEHLGF